MGHSQLLNQPHTFANRNTGLPSMWDMRCAGLDMTEHILLNVGIGGRGASTHAHRSLLLRHELAGCGHLLLEMCSHGRQEIREDSPGLERLRLERTMKLSKGALTRGASRLRYGERFVAED